MKQFNINLDALSKPQDSGVKTTWKTIPRGRFVFRLLPPWSESGQLFKTVYSHSIEFHGANTNRWSWTCTDRSSSTPCVICEHLKKLKMDGGVTNKFEDISKQYYCNALIIEDPDYNGSDKGCAPGTLVLLRLPKTVMDYCIEQIMNPLVGNITDLETGVAIEVNKTGQGLQTRYNCGVYRKGRFSIVDDVADKELYDLDEVFGKASGNDDLMQELKLYLTRECMGAVTQPMDQMNPAEDNRASTMAPNPVAITPIDNSPKSEIQKPTGCPERYSPTEITCVLCANSAHCPFATGDDGLPF